MAGEFSGTTKPSVRTSFNNFISKTGKAFAYQLSFINLETQYMHRWHIEKGKSAGFIILNENIKNTRKIQAV